MAYYSPNKKAAITPAIKELCKKYGVRATLSVRGNNEIRLVIASGAIDFVGTANEITEHRCSVRGETFHANTGYIQVNTFHIDTNFKGTAAEFLKEAFAIMNAAVARARLDAQRAKNGGLTDAEMRKKEREEKIASDRAALESCHGDVFATVRESGDEFGRAVLASVLERGYASEKQLNFIYGVAERYIAAKNAKNEYFGEVGKRIKVVLTVRKWIQLRPATFTFSALWLCIAQDAEGRTFKYMGGSASCLPMSGETREVTFTVKGHDEYNGTKQTVMARPAYKD